jgi:hypothetical protein
MFIVKTKIKYGYQFHENSIKCILIKTFSDKLENCVKFCKLNAFKYFHYDALKFSKIIYLDPSPFIPLLANEY